MNKVITVGRLTGDPKVETVKGKKKANFCMALDRVGEGTDYPWFTAWEQRAEIVEKHLYKGMRVLIESHIHTGNYENKEGKKINTTDFVVDRIEFLDKKKENAQPEKNDGESFMIPEGIEEEIPFT